MTTLPSALTASCTFLGGFQPATHHPVGSLGPRGQASAAAPSLTCTITRAPLRKRFMLKAAPGLAPKRGNFHGACMTEGPSSNLGTSPPSKWWLRPQLHGGCVPPFLCLGLSEQLGPPPQPAWDLGRLRLCLRQAGPRCPPCQLALRPVWALTVPGLRAVQLYV